MGTCVPVDVGILVLYIGKWSEVERNSEVVDVGHPMVKEKIWADFYKTLSQKNLS